MTKRIKKIIKPDQRLDWLKRFRGGESPPKIAERDEVDVRTVVSCMYRYVRNAFCIFVVSHPQLCIDRLLCDIGKARIRIERIDNTVSFEIPGIACYGPVRVERTGTGKIHKQGEGAAARRRGDLCDR